jgi:hypothetical protein
VPLREGSAITHAEFVQLQLVPRGRFSHILLNELSFSPVQRLFIFQASPFFKTGHLPISEQNNSTCRMQFVFNGFRDLHLTRRPEILPRPDNG